TFLARDDTGNSFAIRGLGGILGTAVTTLRSNSTLALQNYLWVLGRQTIANVTVSYAVRRQFCQPAGLEIAISGQVDWRIAKASLLSMRFSKPPTEVDAQRAWFGARNDSRVQRGFDWGHGTLNPDGTITKTLTDAPVGFPGVCGPYIINVISNSVVLDSYQNLFASFETTTGTCPRGYQAGSDTPSYITVLKWTNSTNK